MGWGIADGLCDVGDMVSAGPKGMVAGEGIRVHI